MNPTTSPTAQDVVIGEHAIDPEGVLRLNEVSPDQGFWAPLLSEPRFRAWVNGTGPKPVVEVDLDKRSIWWGDVPDGPNVRKPRLRIEVQPGAWLGPYFAVLS